MNSQLPRLIRNEEHIDKIKCIKSTRILTFNTNRIRIINIEKFKC